MFEECFSMIELNALLDMTSTRPVIDEDEQLYNHMTSAVLSALEAALFDPEQAPEAVH